MPGKHNQGAGTIASEISSSSAAAILNRHVSESRVLPLDPCPCASPKPRPNEKSCAPPARAAGQNYLTIGRALERLGFLTRGLNCGASLLANQIRSPVCRSLLLGSSVVDAQLAPSVKSLNKKCGWKDGDKGGSAQSQRPI